MHLYISAKRPNRWPSSAQILKASSLALILLVLVTSGSEAIVKQHQQRSDDSQAVQQQAGNGPQQQQQQQQSHQHQSSAYNNHKSSSLIGGASSPSAVNSQGAISGQPTYSSSISISSPSGSSNSQPMIPSSPLSSSSPGSSSAQSAPSSSSSSSSSSPQNSPSASVSAGPSQANQQQQSNYATYISSASSGAPLGNQKSAYLASDNMAAAASNNDQSYQAAANSVNMALANLGVYGNSGYNSQGGSSDSGSNSNNNNNNNNNNGPSSLNPLHYFYYPSKQDSAQQQAKAAGGSGLDLMSNAASNNNYQSMAFPSYADQLNSALSGLGAASPEAAASSQDPSYLPQPGLGSGAMNGLDGSNGNQQGANSMYQHQQQGQQHSAQMGGHQASLYNGASSAADLSGYASNLSPQAQVVGGPQSSGQHGSGSIISFNGPSAGAGPSSDYLNAAVGSGHQQSQQHQQQQQSQIPQLSAYQSNLYNQMGDLSTSNFGNNAGGLSSVASYVSPGQQDHSGSQHDLFGGSSLGSGNGQQFNPAASQLSPSVVAPVSGNQQQGSGNQMGSNGNAGGLNNGASSLFSTSSLFGQQSPSNSANNLFSNQHLLSSYLTPQQYNSFTGQQSGVEQQLNTAGSSPAASAASSVAPTGSSSKRFGISSFIMPMLALAGLSLLIPTMSNIGTAVGRKKRSIDDDRASMASRQQQISFDSMNGTSQLAKEMSIRDYMDKIERYYSIYKNAVENDDCLNRLICEFGDAVKDVTGKSTVVMVIEKIVPTWMTGKVHLFKEAALGNKEGKEKCKKYVCQSSKQQH